MVWLDTRADWAQLGSKEVALLFQLRPLQHRRTLDVCRNT